MSKTKFGYTVNTCNMPGNIIEYGELSRPSILSNGRHDGLLMDRWYDTDGVLWNNDEVYDTYEQAKAEAERQIDRDIAALEEDLRDYRSIVLFDPKEGGK